MTVLITGATGMFGGLITSRLQGDGVDVLAVTRSPERAASLTTGSVTGVVADMDDVGTLQEAISRADRIFLLSPMHPDLSARECAVIEMARSAGVSQIVKLYGAVEHEGDPLDTQHHMAIDALKQSGLSWCLVSPQTVMDSHLLAQAESIREEHRMYACAGDGRMGIVSADNCAEVASHVLQSPVDDYQGLNLQITGPEAVTFSEMASQLTEALGVTIEYIDMSEDEFGKLAVEAGFPAEDLELQILCHFRQIRNGKAMLVTDTFEKLIGRPPASVKQWASSHRDLLLKEIP